MGTRINVEEWIDLFKEVGVDDDEKRMTWHKLFESRHPEAHQSFLEWLGLPQQEISAIRLKSR